MSARTEFILQQCHYNMAGYIVMCSGLTHVQLNTIPSPQLSPRHYQTQWNTSIKYIYPLHVSK